MTPALRTISILSVVVLIAGALPRQETFDALARSSLARIEGRQAIPGLRDSVRVIRDRWGVPHIYAQNIDDLFLARRVATQTAVGVFCKGIRPGAGSALADGHVSSHLER